MKSHILIVWLVLWLNAPLLAATPERILFIGNSYTSVNDLPRVFSEILAGAQIPVPRVKAVTPGGKTLLQHATSQPKSLEAIEEGNWDVVVLQGQSQEAAFSENNPVMRSNFTEGAKTLCEHIRKSSPNSRIIFYQTWARHPSFWNASQPDLASTYGKDPLEMQARTRFWYAEVAKANQATVAPVGDCWERNYQSSTPLQLHAADHSHPQFSGTYLAALVLYRTISAR